VYASVIDFAHFVETLLAHGGAMLSPASVEAMTTGHASMQAAPAQSYGYVLITCEPLGVRLLMHPGGALGVRSTVLMAPDRGFGVVVFVNGSFDPLQVAYGALAAFVDVPEVLLEQVLTAPASWQRYAGTYRGAWGGLGRSRVYIEEDKLRPALLGGQPEAIPATLIGRRHGCAQRDALRHPHRRGRAGAARRRRTLKDPMRRERAMGSRPAIEGGRSSLSAMFVSSTMSGVEVASVW
jgi:CubicO group peptidase (beta-lactamase class C family)